MCNFYYYTNETIPFVDLIIEGVNHKVLQNLPHLCAQDNELNEERQLQYYPYTSLFEKHSATYYSVLQRTFEEAQTL